MPQENSLISADSELPPILHGQATPQVEEKVRKFLFSVAAIYESWLGRRTSPHTRRSYDQDVMNFVRGYLGLRWPEDASKFLQISVQTVQGYRDFLVASNAAPKTINRLISSLSGFYKYLAASAAELHLPIIVPNPAHSQFIPRASSDAVIETKALTLARARELISTPSGDSLLDYRDRAILKFFVYSGARLAAGCSLSVADFSNDECGATVRLREKEDRRSTIGLHFAASQSIQEYIEKAELTSGHLFRVQKNSRSDALGDGGLKPLAMYRLLLRYLLALPNSTREVIRPDGSKTRVCLYSPHSLSGMDRV